MSPESSRSRRYRYAAAVVGVAGIVLLSACSYIPFIGKKKSDEAQSSAPACPVAAVLRPLANTAVFAPTPDKKPINVAWYGLFSDITVTCRINGDGLSASIDNIVVAERGPAVRGNDVDFNYFIALTDANHGPTDVGAPIRQCCRPPMYSAVEASCQF